MRNIRYNQFIGAIFAKNRPRCIEAAFFPRISLTAGVGSASSELSQLFKDGSWGWTLAPQLLLPIFDAGRNKSNLDMANTSKNIAVAQYEKAIQTAFREVADALAGRETLAQQFQASEALLQSESKRSHLTQLRFDHGASSLLDSLDAQRSLFAAQQSHIQTRLAVLQSAEVIALRRLSGSMLREILDGAAQPRPKFEPRLWPCALPRPEGRGLPRCFFDQITFFKVLGGGV